MASKRLDAVKLAKSSRWEDLRRLVDAEPTTAQQEDSYGMLPLHWACTEPQSISESVLLALLKAYPQGARVPNTAEMLPLHIAIKAQARIEWLQGLLASYPDAVLKKTPIGENAVELARKAGLPSRSLKLLEEMYHHVCAKEGLTDQLAMEGEARHENEQDDRTDNLRPSERFQAIAGDLPIPQRVSSGQTIRQVTKSHKIRSFSDNDFYSQPSTESVNSNLTSGIKAWSPRRTVESMRPPSVLSQRSSTTRNAIPLPPRWMNAPSCSICAQKFGTFKKRHHCRNCGQSICRDHSARERMKLPHYGLQDRHRVCVVCHDMLRNATRQQVQVPRLAPPPRISQAISGDARRSDETPRAPPLLLERHVSAPARASNPVAGPYQSSTNASINEQVASLQKRVTQLMEEKEQAEMQLRVQAEMLNDPDRLTNVLRTSNGSGGSGSGNAPMTRDQNSPAMHVRTGSPASTTALTGIIPAPASTTALTGIPAPRLVMHRSTGQLLDKTPGNFQQNTANLLPSPQLQVPPLTTASSTPLQRTTRLQDALNTIAAVESTYDDLDGSDSDSDIEGRSTDIGDLHDAEADVDIEDEEDVIEAVEFTKAEEDIGIDTLPEVDVLVNLGHVMMEKGSVSAAVQAFTRAVEIRPDDPSLHSLLGRAYYADENLDDAVASITKSLELEPSATNSTLLGKILFEKGDHEQAIAAYQQSLDMQRE